MSDALDRAKDEAENVANHLDSAVRDLEDLKSALNEMEEVRGFEITMQGRCEVTTTYHSQTDTTAIEVIPKGS